MLGAPQTSIIIRKKTVERLRALQVKNTLETERKRSYDELINSILDGNIKPV